MNTPVFIQAGYAWKKEARIPTGLDANKVGTEIAAITDERGEGKYAAVVDVASNPTSAMHTYFEWDDSAAAQAHRIDQARYLVRSVVPVVVNAHTEDEYTATTRVFVSQYVENDGKREDAGVFARRPVHHVPILRIARSNTLPRDEDPPAVVISVSLDRANTETRQKGLAALRTWAKAYERDSYFAGVVAAIRALKD